MCEEFQKRLRQFRTRKGVSQRALSQLCGLGKNTIARYESGEITPTLPALLEIADYLGVTLDDLAGRGKIQGAWEFGTGRRGPPGPPGRSSATGNR